MTIFQKWLAIVAIPLAFEIIFVIVLVGLVVQEDAEVMQQVRSQIIKSTVEKVLASGDECAFLLVQYGYTKDPQLIEDCLNVRKQSLVWINDVAKIIEKSDSRQVEAVRHLSDAWSDFAGIADDVGKWSNVPVSTDVQIFSLMSVREKINAGSAAVQELYSYRNAIDEETKQRHASTRMVRRFWLTLGIIANILFGVALTIYFSRDITNRINALKENSLRLSSGQDLLPSKGGTDEIAEFDAVFYDVATALQDAFDRERANFDSAADAICALDQSGRITRVNDALAAVVGLPAQQILESSFADHVAAENIEKLNEVLETVRRDDAQRHELEVKMRTASGRTRDFLWSLVWESEFKLFMCVGRDVTAYKQLEHAKQEFVAMLSHDLRSPLSSIGATFELVANGAYGEPNPKMSTTVDRALQNVRRLISLVSELLDLEKLEAGEMELNISKTRVAAVVEQAVSAVSASADANKIMIKHEPTDLLIYVDEDRIVRVIINFLSNAIKYSPKDGVITIDAIEQDDGVEISVSDQGNGIAEEHLDNIFDRYKQVSRRDHTVMRGSGLGLSICRAIIEAHNGRIGVKSSVGKGSTFWFRVP